MYAVRPFNQHQLNMLSFLLVWLCPIKCTKWSNFTFDWPFIDDKVASAWIPTLGELPGGIDIGVDRDEGDDEAQNPDADDERDHDVAT